MGESYEDRGTPKGSEEPISKRAPLIAEAITTLRTSRVTLSPPDLHDDSRSERRALKKQRTPTRKQKTGRCWMEQPPESIARPMGQTIDSGPTDTSSD